MPVGGSRHYAGGGLGQEGIWKCPSCGADNEGPIPQGCTRCGAGRPGRHVGHEAPPPPPAPAPLPEGPEGEEHLGVFDRWVLTHPHATLEEAFTGGYIEGVRAQRRVELSRPLPDPALDPEGKVPRTIVAALGYFANQILSSAPPEVATGEWCSVDEVRTLIHRLITTGEVAHA